MQRKQVLRFGVILAFALVTRRQGSFDTMTEYTILHRGTVLYKGLTEEEYFDRMEDLSIEYYQKGTPRPQDLETKVIKI